MQSGPALFSENLDPCLAVLVTGGSGYLGQNLVKNLSHRKETVVSIYRQRLPQPLDNVFPVFSDLASEELLAAPLRGVKTVVHLAWERNLLGPDHDFSVDPLSKAPLTRNIKLLQNLLRAMEKAKTKRFIFLSALGAKADSPSAFLREKYLGEFFTLNSSIPERIVLRSSVLFGGADCRFVQTIKKSMWLPGFYPVPRDKNKISPLHVEDISEFIAYLVNCPLSQGSNLIDICGRENCGLEQIYRYVSDSLGKKSSIAVSSHFGQLIYPLFERETRDDRPTMKMRNFLALGRHKDEAFWKQNPLKGVGPKLKHSFKESLEKEAEALAKAAQAARLAAANEKISNS